MPSASIDFAPLKKELDQLERRNALGRVMPVIAEVLVGAVHETFEQEGPGWAPLSPATLARRRAKGSGAKILQDSSVLVNSITPAWEGRTAEAYTDVPYGKFHVFGTSRMPKRDFTAIDLDEAMEEIRDIVYQALTGPA